MRRLLSNFTCFMFFFGAQFALCGILGFLKGFVIVEALLIAAVTFPTLHMQDDVARSSFAGVFLALLRAPVEACLASSSLQPRHVAGASATAIATIDSKSHAAPWICRNCGEENPQSFDICWSCAHEKPSA